MGKGDKKSKRGKILMGSYGVRRPRRKGVQELPVKIVKEEVVVKAQKEKPAARHKAEHETVQAEAPVLELTGEVAEKPAKKRTSSKPKTTAKKEDMPE